MIINNSKPCNRANYGGTRTQTKYIVVHYTSNKGDTANNNAVYFNREALKNPASAHYFVDENEIWSSVPENMIAYHCGAKSYKHPYCRNANSIGVEICMNDRDGAIRLDSIDKAVELVKSFMQKYGVPIKNVIRHYDVTGKNCPAPMAEDETLWANFKAQLESEEEEVTRYKYWDNMPDYAKATIAKLETQGIIQGRGDSVLDLSDDMVRMYVSLDRASMFELEAKINELSTKINTLFAKVDELIKVTKGD